MITLVVSAVLVAAALYLHRGALYPIFPTVVTLGFMLLGYEILDSREGMGVAPFYAACALAAFVGWALAGVPRAQRGPGMPAIGAAEELWRRRTGGVFAAVLLFLLFYHFAVGGIPLFMEAVETQRFNFTSSGLFGIPGRVLLYGIPFLVLYATMHHDQAPSGFSRALVRASWVAYAVSMVLSGFKGSIAGILLMYLFTAALTRRPLTLAMRNLARYAAALAIGVAFAFAMSFRYSSVGLSDNLAAMRYLADRLTTMPAEPGYYAVAHLGPHPKDASYNGEDLRYFASKYFGLGDRSDRFPLDKRVSAAIYGTALDEENFIVPVTVGAPANLAVDIGRALTVCAMLLLGYLYGRTFVRAQRARTPFAAATWAFAAQTVHAFLTRGAFAYLLVNFAAVMLMLWAIHVACCALVATAVPVFARGAVDDGLAGDAARGAPPLLPSVSPS